MGLVAGITDWSPGGVVGMWRLVLGMIVDLWILAYCLVLEQPLSSHCVWWCSSVKHCFLLALAAELCLCWLVLEGCCCGDCIVDASIFIIGVLYAKHVVFGVMVCYCLYLCDIILRLYYVVVV